jgi:sodium/potassium/calcium exchanger 6
MTTCEWGMSEDELGPFGVDYKYIYYCSPASVQWFILLLFGLWIAFLINMLAQTASNYFSPTLSKICDNLRIPYDIAGVTFLAFGNGAPDFFSLLASFSGGVDVLVGVGALLGGSMFVCTVVVGTIAILCPCEVEKQFFLRDISFHLVAVLSVAAIALIRHISVPVACGLLLLYVLYAVLVIISSYYNQTSNEDVNTAAGDIVLKDFSSLPTAGFVQTAFWHPNPLHNQKKKKEFKKFVPPAPSTGGYSFLILKEHDEDPENAKESNEKEADEDGTINISGGFEPSFDDIIKDDFFNPSITESHFSIEETPEDGQANTLEQSLLRPEETPPHEHDEIVSRFKVVNRIKPQNMQKYKNMMSALYWQQWALRKSFRRHSAPAEEHTWFSYLYSVTIAYLEKPFDFARDLTIPTLDESEWKKMYAVIHPISCPLYIVFILGHSYDTLSGFPLVLLCFLVGLVPSIALFLLTTQSRRPDNPLFKVVWTLTAFVMCVMWVFTFAGELITLLVIVCQIIGVPPAFLGLTVLAWGNSIGDLFTNKAVALEGLGAMAIAGCYAGPVFNILMGFGVALVYATVQAYPKSYTVALDTSSIVSICFLVVALTSTMGIVSYRGFKLDRSFGIYLISLYITYTALQCILVIMR